MTEPPQLQPVGRTFVLHRGRRLSFFGGCDYFRLASHPRVLRAVERGVRKSGLNVAASRLTTGNHPLYGELENALAEFFHAEAALLVSNGYATNLVVAQALAGEFSHVLLDEKAHASLRDAARLFGCPVVSFCHRDVEDMARHTRKLAKSARPILLTDGLFAHDGGVAPLRAYLRILPSRARLLVDDAHGAGVMGQSGQGSLEHEAVSRRRIIQTITLSKAFGVFGGAVLGSAALRRRIMTRSRMFVGGTPLPLPLVNGAFESVNILKSTPGLRRRLLANAARVKSALRAEGMALPDNPGPIIPLTPATPRAAESLRRRLLAAGIYPPFLKYPGCPPQGCFRFVISSGHTREQLDNLISALVPRST